jgi:hypothetical protein
VFVEWSWDGQRLTGRSDRYGCQPLYYWCGRDEIILSPSIAKLLAEGAPAALDYEGLSVFLRLGFFIGDDTPFKGIRAVPPNGSFVWEDGQLRMSGGPVRSSTASVGRVEALNIFTEILGEAVRRRLPNDRSVVVPLSGGRDSRHILFQMHRRGVKPQFCLTMRYYPPYQQREVPIAARVAAALGVEHVILDQPRSRLVTELDKNVRTGFCALEHIWAVAAADYLSARAQCITDGIGGDVLAAGLFLTDSRLRAFEAGRFQDLAQDLLGSEGLTSLLTPVMRPRLDREQAVTRLVHELQRHADAPNPVGSFIFWNRTRRQIALCPFGLFGALDVMTPYLDPEVFDFLSSLPAAFFLDHSFHTEAIHLAFPQFADLPYEEKKRPARRSETHFRKFAYELGRFSLKRYPSTHVSYSYLWPRLVRGWLDVSQPQLWRIGGAVIYLLQLENLNEAT